MTGIRIHWRIIGILLALPLVLSAQTGAGKYPDGLYAEVLTSKGLIVLQLEYQKTPMTAANFVGLAEGTIQNAAFPLGIPFFNGTKFHRVAPGHVIQTGIAPNGKSAGPGYEFPNEIRLPELSHGRAGMLNMANSGPHTNASQWCITLGDRSYLDGDYTVFGHVVQGMDVVFAIVQGDEIKSIKIVRAGEAAGKFRPTTESFQKMVEQARARVQAEEQKRKIAEEKAIQAKYPNARNVENGIRFVVVREGRGDIPAAGAKMRVAYSGKTLGGVEFASTADAGSPYFGSKAEAFEMEAGRKTPQINRGFDAMVAQMKQGEKRTLIIPGNQAYGVPGFYGKEVPGRKRFHISPNATLIYEVEALEILK